MVEAGPQAFGAHLAEAVSRVRRLDAAPGRPPARPADMLQRYAMARAMRARSLAGLSPLDTWEPAQLLDLVCDFLEDLGHLCDEEGTPYLDAAREALGVPVGFVGIPTGLPGSPPPYRPDPGGPRSDGAHAASAALALAYGDEAWTGTHAAHAIRQAMRLGEEVGLDVDDAFSLGVGAWASTRDGAEGEIEWVAHPGRA